MVRVLQVKRDEVPQALVDETGDRQEANMVFGRLVLDVMDKGHDAAEAKRLVAARYTAPQSAQQTEG